MMKDLFSGHARQYAAFRPVYPAALYEFIFSLVKEKNTAWDCATGNGQVAKVLAGHFKEVCATDISQQQLNNAFQATNIDYSLASAEKTTFPDNFFDLITVGQALHWFDFDKFFAEVKRVGKVGGVLAIWGYNLLQIEPELDTIIHDFYKNIVGSYWESERKHVDDKYQSISFPFDEIQLPDFQISISWTLDDLANYLTTWSSVQKFIRQQGANPVDVLKTKLAEIWHENEKKQFSFPLFGRIGMIS
jgi:ubiquinone/menaquinone biosynthesis C-methylase UbiE